VGWYPQPCPRSTVHHSSQPGYSISLSEAAGSSASCWSLFLQSSVLIVPEEGAMANFLLLSRSPLTGRPYSRSRQSTRQHGLVVLLLVPRVVKRHLEGKEWCGGQERRCWWTFALILYNKTRCTMVAWDEPSLRLLARWSACYIGEETPLTWFTR
jgi:hypothetical protein